MTFFFPSLSFILPYPLLQSFSHFPVFLFHLFLFLLTSPFLSLPFLHSPITPLFVTLICNLFFSPPFLTQAPQFGVPSSSLHLVMPHVLTFSGCFLCWSWPPSHAPSAPSQEAGPVIFTAPPSLHRCLCKSVGLVHIWRCSPFPTLAHISSSLDHVTRLSLY